MQVHIHSIYVEILHGFKMFYFLEAFDLYYLLCTLLRFMRRIFEISSLCLTFMVFMALCMAIYNSHLVAEAGNCAISCRKRNCLVPEHLKFKQFKQDEIYERRPQNFIVNSCMCCVLGGGFKFVILRGSLIK